MIASKFVSSVIFFQLSLVSFSTRKHEVCEAVSSTPSLTLNLVPKHEAVRRLTEGRRLQAQPTDALYQGYGTHYVDLWVGFPTPQRQTVMVDTGSSVTAFPCAGCKNCGERFHTDSLYEYRASDTFRASTCDSCGLGACESGSDLCHVSINYLEGSSWNAFVGRDRVYMGGNHKGHLTLPHQDTDDFEFVFGCQTSISGQFVNQLENGILGLSKKKEGSFWFQMFAQGKILERSFSLCYDHQPIASKSGTNAGVMSMGGYNDELHKSPLVFVKDYGTDLYTVYVEAVYLRANGGERARPAEIPVQHTVHKLDISESQLNKYPVIVDSGTTYTFLTKDIMTTFEETWKEITGIDYNVGVPLDITHGQLLSLPTVLFQMRADPDSVNSDNVNFNANLAGDIDPHSPTSIIVALPASRYMEYTNGKYTPRLYLNKSGLSILGANTMQGHDVFFDLENDRIGWAESNCVPGDFHPELLN